MDGDVDDVDNNTNTFSHTNLVFFSLFLIILDINKLFIYEEKVK